MTFILTGLLGIAAVIIGIDILALGLKWLKFLLVSLTPEAMAKKKSNEANEYKKLAD